LGPELADNEVGDDESEPRTIQKIEEADAMIQASGVNDYAADGYDDEEDAEDY